MKSRTLTACLIASAFLGWYLGTQHQRHHCEIPDTGWLRIMAAKVDGRVVVSCFHDEYLPRPSIPPRKSKSASLPTNSTEKR